MSHSSAEGYAHPPGSAWHDPERENNRRTFLTDTSKAWFLELVHSQRLWNLEAWDGNVNVSGARKKVGGRARGCAGCLCVGVCWCVLFCLFVGVCWFVLVCVSVRDVMVCVGVCWCVLVCWCVGVLVCWCVGVQGVLGVGLFETRLTCRGCPLAVCGDGQFALARLFMLRLPMLFRHTPPHTHVVPQAFERIERDWRRMCAREGVAKYTKVLVRGPPPSLPPFVVDDEKRTKGECFG